jgi:hypothetical protein
MMLGNMTQLRVDGLTALQLAELRDIITSTAGDYITTVDSPRLTGGRVGEPTLLSAVIMLAPSVISAIALWLAKDKKKRTKNLKYTKIGPNGSSESFEMEESSYDEGESTVSALQAFLNRKLGDDRQAAG